MHIWGVWAELNDGENKEAFTSIWHTAEATNSHLAATTHLTENCWSCLASYAIMNARTSTHAMLDSEGNKSQLKFWAIGDGNQGFKTRWVFRSQGVWDAEGLAVPTKPATGAKQSPALGCPQFCATDRGAQFSDEQAAALVDYSGGNCFVVGFVFGLGRVRFAGGSGSGSGSVERGKESEEKERGKQKEEEERAEAGSGLESRNEGADKTRDGDSGDERDYGEKDADEDVTMEDN
ncbi:hypothetical protein JB92DRAFT_3121044 [Gautieria morchelliformis]|nr:hypothetical protein JB92DRAFT_3121044 [Gautieria morchelliformis]